jgi:hypothetical protein
MAVRFYNHVGYMISIPLEVRVARALARARHRVPEPRGLFYLFGIRSFFYAVPLVSGCSVRTSWSPRRSG